MASPRLTQLVALPIVCSALDGLRGVTCSFEHSYGRVDLKLSCEAMVLQPFLANGSAGVDLVRLGAANRAVALCFAVSCCAGYAFHENQEFWSQSLRLDMDSIAVLATGELGYAFPPVVLSPMLSADPASRFAKSEDYLRGFFGLQSGVVSTPSKHFVLSMEMLGEYMLPEQWTLKTMSLDKCLDDLQRVVALVNEVFRSITMAAVQFRVTVHSIRIDKGPRAMLSSRF